MPVKPYSNELTGELERAIDKLHETLDSCRLPDENRKSLCSAIRLVRFKVTPLPNLTSGQIKKINEKIAAVYSRYDSAYTCARNYPATNDCDEYAIADVRKTLGRIK